jgi:hypothetical protein
MREKSPLMRRKKSATVEVALNFSATGGGGQKMKPRRREGGTQNSEATVALEHIALHNTNTLRCSSL